MISISVVGRLAQQPALQLLGDGTQVCEFALLSSRFYYDKEITESATFFCYGDMAEEISSSTVKGQEMSVSGIQETRIYRSSAGPQKRFVRYRLTWFQFGRRPYNPDMAGPTERAERSSQQSTGFTTGETHNSESSASEGDTDQNQGMAFI